MILKFSEKFHHQFSHFLYLVTCFLRIMVSLLCRSQRRTILSPFTKLDRDKLEHVFFDTACNRHSNGTVTLRKNISKYKNVRKWMVEFLRKFENCGTKIKRVNSLLMIKINKFTVFYFNFLWCWGRL